MAVMTAVPWLPPDERHALEVGVRRLMAANRVTVERGWNRPTPVACTYHAPSWVAPRRWRFWVGPWQLGYPHQWFWDSCAHAIILASLEPSLAQAEVRSLLYAQRPDGFIPHLIWHPGRLHWLDRVLRWTSPSPHTSTYLQPPLLAEAVAHIHQATGDRAFLREVLPALTAYYDYLHRERCPSGDGLAEIIISYESGMDRSPEYDAAYGSSTAGAAWRGPLARLLIHHWRLRHHLGRILDSQRFRVKDLLFNCIFARNQALLARLLEEVGQRGAATFRERARLTEQAILAKMYHPETGLFHSLDARHGGDRPLPRVTLSTFMPLLLSSIGQTQVAGLLAHLADPDQFWARYPVPVEPVGRAAATPRKHVIWRGLQTWLLPNWLIVQGLHLQAQRFPSMARELTRLAEGIARRSYELVRQHGFWEYYHSQTGEGGGAPHFAWSGLVWDMLQPPEAGTPVLTP